MEFKDLSSVKFDIWFVVMTCMAIFFLIQLFYFLYFYLKLARYKEPNMGLHEGQPVSVIIAARNELTNLKENLPAILEQNYGQFQVVVVNDRSWDQTPDYLRELSEKYAHLHVVTVHDHDLYAHGKKMAVTLGVKGAKYDLLLFTDADCKPDSKDWISEMVKGYSGNEIVLGYSPQKRERGLLNWLIRFDTVQVGMQYLSYALAGVPYMGVGRNMSYKKDLFFKQNGFKKHYHIQSGDDDLFINQAATRDNVSIRLNGDAFMMTRPKTTFKDWWWQKKRHFSSSGFYKFKHKVLLTVYPVTLLLFTLAMVVSLFGPYLWLALGLYMTRITIQLLIFNAIYKKLGARELLVLTPFLELIFLFINPLIHISNAFVKPNKWA